MILVVDDNADDLTILVSSLRHFGYTVVSASDGESGFRLVRDWKPQLAVIDLAMPGIAGTDLARAIREDPELRDTRLIAVTAHPEYRALAERAGFDAFFGKPVRAQELVGAVRTLLEGRAAEHEQEG